MSNRIIETIQNTSGQPFHIMKDNPVAELIRLLAREIAQRLKAKHDAEQHGSGTQPYKKATTPKCPQPRSSDGG